MCNAESEAKQQTASGIDSLHVRHHRRIPDKPCESIFAAPFWNHLSLIDKRLQWRAIAEFVAKASYSGFAHRCGYS